jgi:hypothetical protein
MGVLAKPLAFVGANVPLAYLLSEMPPSAIELFHLDDWYARLAQPDFLHAVARSAGCGVVVLVVSTVLNRLGFRLAL